MYETEIKLYNISQKLFIVRAFVFATTSQPPM